MLLAFDIGNTNVVGAVFVGAELAFSFRLLSDERRSVDQYALEVIGLLELGKCAKIDQVVIGSVVPPLTRVFAKLARKYLAVEPITLSAKNCRGITLKVDVPEQVGIDRVANAIALKRFYGAPALAIDLGTATTFDLINSDGDFVGGAIAPGLMVSAQGLFGNAALLSSIELSPPRRAIGTNTRDNLLSGIFFGYAGLIEGVVSRIEREIGKLPTVVATGGFAGMLAELTPVITTVNSDLTLHGYRFLSEELND